MNKIILGMAFMLFSVGLLSCDICNIYTDVTPNINNNQISLIYRNRFLQGTYGSNGQVIGGVRHGGGQTIQNSEIQENYHVYELRFRYFISNRLFLIGSLPYVKNEQMVDDKLNYHNKGIGDPVVMGNYILYNSPKSDSTKIKHRVVVGGGIKFPLGIYNKNHDGNEIPLDLQSGTGSYDFLFNLEYLIRYKRFGFGNNANYKSNTANDDSYLYGNTFNLTSSLFYLWKIDESTVLMPFAGVYYENAMTDINNRKEDFETGGEIFYQQYGCQANIDRIGLTATYQSSIKHNYNGNTQLPTQNRLVLSMSYNF